MPLITEWWRGLDVVTLVCRPRRFGKTLNMDTLDCFFSDAYAGRGDLFEGLTVWDDPAMRQERGYAAELVARGVPRKRVREYGFAFEGKRVLIG